MEIRIEDYFKKQQIEQAILDEVKNLVRSNIKNDSDIKRLISNSAYDMVSSMVDECFDNSLEELLREKVKGVITELTHYTVFKRPDVWDREPNSAYEFLHSIFEEMKPIVKSRFITAVENGVDTESVKMVKDELHEQFMNWADNKFLTK